MDKKIFLQEISQVWDDAIIPQLADYIRIPNKSPAFDPNWEENGYMQQAMDLVLAWCRKQSIKGMSLKVHKLPGQTPLLIIDIPGLIAHQKKILRTS